tara:strand:- start:155 stop:370 length:216 start_codon:yes stop_codon:yes gene_type:complete
MNSYLQGLITGAVLGSSLFFFIGSSPAPYYDIDDVMKKVKNIEDDVSWIRTYGVECDGGDVDRVNYSVDCD